MRIIQTFWTAGRNPLEHSFGWLRPEYNLMAWTLSCLSIKEHYDEVALYTDVQGKHILIDLLRLPYTEVHVVYDETLCLPQHWAFAKVKTYAMQTEPFLHIDGDIFLPHPLPEDVCEASLVAQNKEIGTIYYKRMMDRLLQEPAIRLPLYIEEGLRADSISSYNMGIFGGSDMAFIQAYCREVFDFMECNRMNDRTCRQSCIDCNVFFEQVIFGVMIDAQGRKVASVMGKPIRDEGYTRREFCNFNEYDDCRLLHLLGGHKRNKYVTYSFEKFMLRRYPEYVRRIMEYVCQRDKYTCLSVGSKPLNGNLYYSLPELLTFVEDVLVSNKSISTNLLFSEGMRRASTTPFCDEYAEQDVLLHCSTGLSLYELPMRFSENMMKDLKKLLECEPHFPLTHIAIYPSLRQDMLKVVPIENSGAKIIKRMKNGKMTVGQLCHWLLRDICQSEDMASEPLQAFALQHIKYLVNTGILTIERIEQNSINLM